MPPVGFEPTISAGEWQGRSPAEIATNYRIYAQELPCVIERKTHPVEKSEETDAARTYSHFRLCNFFLNSPYRVFTNNRVLTF